MADMLVNLAALPKLTPVLAEQEAKGIEIRRGQPDESYKIAEWVREHSNPNWAVGCEVALEQEPITCYIAVKNDAARVPSENPSDVAFESMLGFACYDVVTKGVFGPTSVREDCQDEGIDTALLLACLHEMAALDYKQAVIGWTAFIEKSGKTDWNEN